MFDRSYIVDFCIYAFALVLGITAIAQERVYPKYPIEVGIVKPNTNEERKRWKTEGTFAVISGKDANLFVKYIEETDEFVFYLEATKEHAATDGYIPKMKFVPILSNGIKIEARKE